MEQNGEETKEVQTFTNQDENSPSSNDNAKKNKARMKNRNTQVEWEQLILEVAGEANVGLETPSMKEQTCAVSTVGSDTSIVNNVMEIKDEAVKLNDHGFRFFSYVTGHYHYRHIWTPKVGEELTSMYELGNVYDEFAVSVLKDDKIVGHVPREFSEQFTTVLKSGGSIKVKIIAKPTNTRRWGIRVPCTYTLHEKEITVQNIRGDTSI